MPFYRGPRDIFFAAGSGVDPRSLAAPGGHLLCDLPGLSRIGAGTVATSERGAAGLQGVTNAVFARTGDVIARHGDAVLQFAGDAVAVFTSAGEGGLVGKDSAAQAEVGAGRVGDWSIDMRAASIFRRSLGRPIAAPGTDGLGCRL